MKVAVHTCTIGQHWMQRDEITLYVVPKSLYRENTFFLVEKYSTL
jgi:hypothetical protein